MNKEKLKGQFRLGLNGILKPFNLYGMGIYVPAAIELIMELLDKYESNLEGEETPLEVDKKRIKW